MKKQTAMTALGWPDSHVPFHDPAAFDAAIAYTSTRFLSWLIFFGDFLDFDQCSRFTQGKAGLVEGRRINEDAAIARAQLERIAKAARKRNPDCKVIFIQGNHEKRLDALTDDLPALKGMLDLPSLLQFEKLGIETYAKADSKGEIVRLEWTDGGIVVRIRNQGSPESELERPSIAFAHGLYHSRHHAQQTIQRYGRGPIFVGHTHDQQTFTHERFGRAVQGGSCGYMGKLHAPDTGIGYIHQGGRPHRWVQGISEWCLDPSRPGAFAFHFHRIIDGKLIGPDGVIYG